MRRAILVPCSVLLAGSASAQGKPADEHFFMDIFLPLMVVFGVLLVTIVIVANVVSARRRALRRMSNLFDPTLGPPPVSFDPGSFNPGPVGTPHTVSKKTTTTNADGSVTVTVVEETTTSGPISFGANGFVDPELMGRFTNGNLEQEILAEVRDAFRHMNTMTGGVQSPPSTPSPESKPDPSL